MVKIIKILSTRQIEIEGLFNDLQMYQVTGHDDYADVGPPCLKKDEKLIQDSEESLASDDVPLETEGDDASMKVNEGAEDESDGESGRHETRMKAANDDFVANSEDEDEDGEDDA